MSLFIIIRLKGEVIIFLIQQEAKRNLVITQSEMKYGVFSLL